MAEGPKLNYNPDQYFSDEEISIIRATFKDNKVLLKILRKIFIPTISDPELPIENFSNDFFLVGKNWGQVPESERGVMVLARQEVLEFIAGGLMKLKVLAASEDETPEQRALRQKKDSSK